MPPQTSEDFYRTLQRLQLVAVGAGRRAWSRMGPDFDASWAQVAPSLVTVTAAAQLAAARTATEYVPAVLQEQGTPVEPLARVRPGSFAGRASDGRTLAGLLSGAVSASRVGVVRGLDGGDALARGQRWLDSALRTVVTDAARDATAAEIVTRPKVQWVRMINPPCCSRCAVLAGSVYGWQADFDRHVNCDCTAIPTTVANADSHLSDARQLVDRGLVTDLTKAQQTRLDEGANLNKVLNESRDRWRERMATDRRAAGPVDRLGRSRPSNWGGGNGKPLIPPGGTIHDLMANLTADVERRRAVSALLDAGIAA